MGNGLNAKRMRTSCIACRQGVWRGEEMDSEGVVTCSEDIRFGSSTGSPRVCLSAAL